MAKGEIIICTTDKSSKFAVASKESYERQGQVHVEKERIVRWEEVSQAQNEVKAHMKAINKMFNIGANHNKERVWEATALRSTVIPLVGVTPKDQ